MSYAPKPDANGVRRYKRDAFDKVGAVEDVKRCIQCVRPQDSSYAQQCPNPRGKGPDGLYCGIHDPDRRQKRDDAKRAAYRKEREAAAKARDRAERLAAAEREIIEAAVEWRGDYATTPRLVTAVERYLEAKEARDVE